MRFLEEIKLCDREETEAECHDNTGRREERRNYGKKHAGYQSKTIREPKYYKRVQFALKYCSYVHFI